MEVLRKNRGTILAEMHKNSYEFLRPVDSFSDTRIMKVRRENGGFWRMRKRKRIWCLKNVRSEFCATCFCG